MWSSVCAAIWGCPNRLDEIQCSVDRNCPSPVPYCVRGLCTSILPPDFSFADGGTGGGTAPDGGNPDSLDGGSSLDGGDLVTVKVAGRFCTEDPATVTLPVKVWFVIDDSGSMVTSDPNKNRFKSATALATKVANPGRMFFGGMTFAGDALTRFSNPRFNDDVTVFNSQVPDSAGSGMTPYLAALDMTASELRADVDENRTLAQRTRYVIIFLSDGTPTMPEPTPSAEVILKVDGIMALGAEVGGITLNAVHLGGAGEDAGVGAAAEKLLNEMALHGKGAYKSFPNGDSLDFAGLDYSPITRTWEQRFFMVTNRSMRPSATGAVADSDRDGLDDPREAALGINPTLADSDGDGCSDLVEDRLGWNPKATVPGECTCEVGKALLDTDEDGLNDCEEMWIGTKSNDSDSDLGRMDTTEGDLVPDGLDFVAMDATYPNSNTDFDVDGVQDIEELRVHADVTNVDKDRQRWQYRYPVFERESTSSRCYKFEVENVALGKTLAASGHPAGENIIELFFAESAQDAAGKDRLFRIATKNVPYAAGKVIVVTPTDFDRLLRAK
jgi:hypothetical protein